ncbi:MAG TPA: c-type cytochrome domain-containing protein [Opitutaceae bacterium]|nr:c-type cytochrome domain-containing protein [Opitutaceae bacterium]
MPKNTEQERPRPPAFLAPLLGALLWAALVWLAKAVPPDGREHGGLGQFVGRLHPLVVHGPVALIALVPLMEIAGLSKRRAHLRSAAGWILAVAAVAAFAAAFDGWLLAWSGGYRGQNVTRHMWGGVLLAGACACASLARAAAARGRGIPGAYPVLLALTAGLMVWTGHGGGAISHGEGFLTDRMPARMRSWLGLPAPVPAAAMAGTAGAPAVPAVVRGGPGSAEPSSPAFYRLHVDPLLERSCVSCHKAAKHKGGLRLDSYGELMKGGDDGPVLVPGNPVKSDVLRRLRLAPSDDDSMPSDGDKPLAPEEVQMIERWIAAGAKDG